jgi:hypothetical protein
MKRALNKGVKKHVKLLWGKRLVTDVAAVGYPAFSRRRTRPPPGQHRFGHGATAAGDVAPPGAL